MSSESRHDASREARLLRALALQHRSQPMREFVRRNLHSHLRNRTPTELYEQSLPLHYVDRQNEPRPLRESAALALPLEKLNLIITALETRRRSDFARATMHTVRLMNTTTFWFAVYVCSADYIQPRGDITEMMNHRVFFILASPFQDDQALFFLVGTVATRCYGPRRNRNTVVEDVRFAEVYDQDGYNNHVVAGELVPYATNEMCSVAERDGHSVWITLDVHQYTGPTTDFRVCCYRLLN